MKKAFIFLCSAIVCLCILLCVPAFAAEEKAAADIGSSVKITGSGFSSFAFLTDGADGTFYTSTGRTEINIESETGIGSLYIMFANSPGEYSVTDNTGKNTVTAGKYGFLHEFIDLTAMQGESPLSVSLSFSGSIRLSEIYVFSEGETPSSVQKWCPPLENNTDLLLFATHGDDDQLFFAGLLPYYAQYKNCRVQVAYLTDHRNLTEQRVHEMLNGLWAVGVTAYPVFGSFADFRIDDMEQTYRYYESIGTSRDDLLSFVTEQLRRFKPLVVVGHDFNGEYGHGMHMIYADLLAKAIEISGDETVFPVSASAYGVWEVKKAYFHLYEQNRITMDYDTPQDCFGGLSAFQVTQKYGYPCHVSQQYTWFTRWINGRGNSITEASQIKTYSPCEFGLYYSTVGEDINKNDLLENIVTYAEQERLEQERQESVAEELSRQEELSRYIENSYYEELSRGYEQSRYEESLEHQRQESIQNETSLRAEQEQKKNRAVISVSVCAVAVIAVSAVAVAVRKKQK